MYKLYKFKHLYNTYKINFSLYNHNYKINFLLKLFPWIHYSHLNSYLAMQKIKYLHLVGCQKLGNQYTPSDSKTFPLLSVVSHGRSHMIS